VETVLGLFMRWRWHFWQLAHTERSVCQAVALFIIVAHRSINSLIWALLLVAIIGPPGPPPRPPPTPPPRGGGFPLPG